ncbi:ABC transporter ATP-binding protein [Polaromonas sp. SM01]|uniref:ABC transporter ATP-binding protein n=1 Tax=Polaromonas sp. SM01 TaxID=3085630 RepID=UPI00298222E4|nr:ATP-binding cassette domain-containing protein [Polaromonas sp. SM01]MDW5442860.1 ATP-binding cassette domain-containing protein [Polaromonas sp. SM01]
MISTRQLAYQYAGGPDLRFEDMDVAQGGVLLLRGASGSGKSTWLALAAGLLTPGAGDITVAGQSLKSLGKVAGDAWRAKTIGFLPQKLHLSSALSVFANLAMAQWAAGQAQDERRIAEALTALDVQDLAARKPAQLSGGQAQRVALARAVLLQPQVILADEPTASLDDEAARQAVELLQATAKRYGSTLVIATHDSRVAASLEGQIGFQPLSIKRNQL